MDERDGFYFHRSFREAIDQLPQKDQLALYKAITKFGLDGVEPEKLTPTQNAFYLLVRPVLAKGRIKAANGKQGGSKTKAKRKQNGSKYEDASGLLLSDKGLGSNSNELRLGTSDKGVNDSAEGALSDGSLFTSFWNAYPESARSDREEAWEAWKKLNPTSDMAEKIMGFLGHWKASKRWTDDGGAFIPAPKNFLNPDKSYLRTIPAPSKLAPPKGASGELGAAELEAIQKVLREETET